MDRDDWVSIPDVRAISDGLALICEKDNRRFGVPTNQIAPHSEVRAPGDHGTLVLPRWFAVDLGLLPASS